MAKRMGYQLVEIVNGKAEVIARFTLLSDAQVCADALATAYGNQYQVEDGSGQLLHESR